MYVGRFLCLRRGRVDESSKGTYDLQEMDAGILMLFV